MLTDTLVIHSVWDEEKGFYIWCTDEQGTPLDVQEWKQNVLAWHEASFYGTFLKEVMVDKLPALLLSPWQAFTFFAQSPENSLLRCELDEVAGTFREIATPLLPYIESGQFMPDFHEWSQGRFGWKPIGVEISGLTQDWFSAALSDWFERDHSLSEIWNEVVEAFPLIKSTATTSVVDENNWLERIGWKKDLTPFDVVLRIDEPELDNGTWKLETILRNKEVQDDSHIYHGICPKKWELFAEKVEQDQLMWCKLVPWLKGEEGIINELTEQQAWEFLTDASSLLVDAGVEILLPAWWQAIKDAQLAVKARVKTSVGGKRQSFVGLQSLINFDWRFSTNGVDLSEEEFLDLVNQQRRLVNIRGRWIKLDPAFIKQVQSILQKANKDGLHVRDVLEQELLALSEQSSEEETESSRPFAGIQIELNRHLSQMITQLTDVKEIPKAVIPGSFKGELRPYQQQGVDWLLFLRRFGFGACLADDMGLGKTIQMIAYFLAIKESSAKTALIICPTSVLGNWQKELEKFSPTLRVHLHYGSGRYKGEEFTQQAANADIVLTSYGLSHLDEEEISTFDWGTICLDEAQNIKNAQTKQSRTIRKLKGDHHIALTGTPMENRLTELWSIFDYINGGYLGSLGQFQKRYVTPIEKDRDEDKIAEVQRLIRPFLLRRTKNDKDVALNLPDKLEQKEYCPLTVEQASLYEQLVKDTLEQVEQLAGIQRKGLILKMLSKLKQVCDHPALYLKEDQPRDIGERSNKMEKLLELVDHIREQNESCLIFTQYIQMGEMIRDTLADRFNEDVLFLNGSVSKAQRDEMIDNFQDRKYSILILSLKAGGTGLNLTEANHVIHYDRWWNPAVENQATDRAYRIGQKRFVHVHKLISTGTLEEKIDEMLEKKQSLNDEIIQSENWITELSTTELKDLLGSF
ncbi:DEAD/DEAH box helicase [Fredinandcohnia sp. SECRCQ15]|uniref:DEAD/DEAH box helicase n=2 Tax=Fredinandcohnia quinoae TaxID=2918902 RepID=A0AAW5E7R6_9BACI|nr:DEAD/DEAH box helicase [Fredinandcohnia sp. SECRCQ15]MCH1625188.1 DEAD/DEAH box helicase [Fredinandcohnia sp. SECRCQ15]